jgi:type I restriction enzyme S subunit
MMHLENFNAGAGVPTLNQNHLHKLKIKVPSTYEEQERVASILSNYDTLISINTKRIKLLEDSARELYKEWFVRLRFPGYEKTKFVKGVPEGWKPKTIDEICDSVGGGTPSTSNANYWGGIIKWVTPTDITSKQSLPLINIEGRITEAGLKHSSAKLLPTGTILMTSRASIGFFGICKEQVCTNQGFISIIPNEENLRMYILCNLMMRKEEIVSKANGATFLEISKGRFRKMEMLIPNNDVLSAFEERCSTIFDAVYNLEIQNQELAVTRDRLLPRLLSGELKVKA